MVDYSAVRAAWQDVEDAINVLEAMKASPTTATLDDATTAQGVAVAARETLATAHQTAFADVDSGRTKAAP